MKIRKEIAVELIKAWQADARMLQVPQDMLKELMESFGFIKYTMFARVVLRERCRAASDLCWDKKFKSAALCLMKNGFTSSRSDVDTELANARANTRRYEKRASADKKKVEELYAKHRRSEQWGVCK